MYNLLQAAKEWYLLTRQKKNNKQIWNQTYFGIPFDVLYKEL